MKKTNSFVLKLLVLVMIAAFTITAVSCVQETITTIESEESGSTSSALGSTTTADPNEITKIGQGAVSFSLTVVFADQSEFVFEIKTDMATLGEALLEHELIGGETTSFGLMVTSVCGVEHKYENGKWWALYTDGTMASIGVSQIEVTSGASYSYVATNA